MSYCKLCRKNVADKVGSHIVPHFLLKMVDNIEGHKSERDYELGFLIESFETTSYFGRSISPEKLNDVFGELSEDEFDEKKNKPLVVNNIFCKSCEERLSAIENEYSKTKHRSGNSEYESGVQSEIGILFWMSVIWRMSINNKSGNKLTSFEEETLRRILDRSLMLKVSDIDIHMMQTMKDVSKISYKLLRCPKFADNNPCFLHFHPLFSKPYGIILGEYILLFCIKGGYTQIKSSDFYGINESIDTATINRIGGNEFIYPITDDILNSVNQKMINKIREQRVDLIDLFLDKVHVACGGVGRTMPDDLKFEVYSGLTSANKKSGRRYTMQDLRDTTFNVLKKYAPNAI